MQQSLGFLYVMWSLGGPCSEKLTVFEVLKMLPEAIISRKIFQKKFIFQLRLSIIYGFVKGS